MQQTVDISLLRMLQFEVLRRFTGRLFYQSNEMTVRVLKSALQEMRVTTMRKAGG